LSQFSGVDDTDDCDGDDAMFLVACAVDRMLLAIVIFGSDGGVFVSWASHLSSNWLTLTGRGTKESLLLLTVMDDELNLLLLTLNEDSFRFILSSSSFFVFSENGKNGGGFFVDEDEYEREDAFISSL
jgi:hypothetical protein